MSDRRNADCKYGARSVDEMRRANKNGNDPYRVGDVTLAVLCAVGMVLIIWLGLEAWGFFFG